MSTPLSGAAAESAAGAPPAASARNAATAPPPKPPPAQNPALKMMGLPRLRLPSRNWLIFLSLTSAIAGAVTYDKYQTRRAREKWCALVAHLAAEPLPPKTLPRRLTIYLAAPPGDGLRMAREHFHTYIKPILVSAAMDWDVIEGRKEGDVRHKTAEKIRRRRKRSGEGTPLTAEEAEAYTVEGLREKNGDVEFPGVAGDIIVGRHTWKEYIRGIHEGYLGPVDLPQEPEAETPAEPATAEHIPGQPSVGDAAVHAATGLLADEPSPSTAHQPPEDASPTTPKTAPTPSPEKPARRFPPSPLPPSAYPTAPLSPSTPEILGPCAAIRFPHLLGFRNTPIRIYRFLTRRHLQEDVGRQVAAAVLGAHRAYGKVAGGEDEGGEVAEVAEQTAVLAFEERDWATSVRKPRAEGEEGLLVEPVHLDERIAGRMRAFEVTGEEEGRAGRIKAGVERARRVREEEEG